LTRIEGEKVEETLGKLHIEGREIWKLRVVIMEVATNHRQDLSQQQKKSETGF
jgi:hypothetical protein